YRLEAPESLLQVMVKNKLAQSRNQARRLVEQQGVKLDGVTVADAMLMLDQPCVLQCGKRHFLRIVR
ncbi:MAG TPA: S4 domain-containing protein, partial [Anaerolineaceae bacterium]|nr:S4 domain-containing protein [Anaerolineaceae bacterium]